MEIENPACGDVLQLTVRISDGSIAEVRFLAKGCVPAMACASALTELLREKSLDEVRTLTREDLIEKVGGLPEASTHASYLAMDAMAALLRKLQPMAESS